VDLFSTDLVLVPINESLHWSLAAVCHLRNLGVPDAEPRPVILLLDSLRTQRLHEPERIVAYLRTYLCMEWKRERAAKGHTEGESEVAALLQALPMRVPKMSKVPQQNNLFDCGLYLVRFARELYKAAASAPQAGGAFDAHSWRPEKCSPSQVSHMRGELKETICELEEAYQGMKQLRQQEDGEGSPRKLFRS